MSLSLAVVSLVCSTLWMSYGVMLVNAFIYVPNVLGVCFSVTQVPDKRVTVGSILDDDDGGDDGRR